MTDSNCLSFQILVQVLIQTKAKYYKKIISNFVSLYQGISNEISLH